MEHGDGNDLCGNFGKISNSKSTFESMSSNGLILILLSNLFRVTRYLETESQAFKNNVC